MADIHNAVKYATGELNAFATAAGMARDQSGVERLGESWTPVLERMLRPELAFLAGDFYAGLFGQQTAVVAEESAVALINPAASRHIVVIEQVVFETVTTNQNALFQLATEAAVRAALAGTENRGTRRDRRDNRLSVASVLVGSEATSIGAEIERGEPNGAGGVYAAQILPVILPPGQAYVVEGQTVNLTINVSFGWREHMALPGEIP